MLQEYVTELYAGHVRQQFPRVRDEILMKMARAKADLADLGLPRTTASQQRRYLVEMQERHKARVEALMSQHMPFVRQDTKDPSGSPWQRKALLTSSFLDKMDLDGCQFAFLHQDDGNELRYENDAARSIDELRRIKKQRPVEDHVCATHQAGLHQLTAIRTSINGSIVGITRPTHLPCAV